MFECLTQRVGLRGPTCATEPDDGDAPASPAGLYLNDLPGISHLGVSLLGTAEAPRAEAVLAESLRTAAVLLAADLQLELASVGQVNLLHTAAACAPARWAHQPDETPNWLAAAPQAQGIVIHDLALPKDPTSPSRLYVAGVEVLLADAAAGVVLSLWENGLVQQTYTFDVPVGGQPVWVPMGYTAQSGSVKLLLPTGVQPALALLNACQTCDVQVLGLGYNAHAAELQSDSGQAPGLRPKVELRCSVEAFACQHADSLAHLLRYRTAIGLLTEALHSERLNAATFDRPALEALRAQYEAQYQRLLRAFVLGQAPALRHSADKCWACRGAKVGRQAA